MSITTPGHLMHDLLGASGNQGLSAAGKTENSPLEQGLREFQQLVEGHLDSSQSPQQGEHDRVIGGVLPASLETTLAALDGKSLPGGKHEAGQPGQLIHNLVQGTQHGRPALLLSNVSAQGRLDERIGLMVSDQARTEPHDMDRLLDELLARTQSSRQAGHTQMNAMEAPGLERNNLAERFTALLEAVNASSSQKQDTAHRLLSVAGIEPLTTTAESVKAEAVNGLSTLLQHVQTRPVLSITAPATHAAAWQQSFGEKIMWMINSNIQGAEIRLNPPELGPLELRVIMNDDQASVSFTSANQQARDMIEAALPRLREMLGENGLNLADVDVSDKPETQGGESELTQGQQASTSENPTTHLQAGTNDTAVIETTIGIGRIDVFA